MATLALNLGISGGKLLMGLLAAHDKRVADARAENSACNAALAALVHDVQVIVDGYNHGLITTGGAVQACIDVDNWYWQYINGYTQYHNADPSRCNPNQFGDNPKLGPKGGRCFQSTQSGSGFTAGLYVGCNIVDANLGVLRAALLSLSNKPPGSRKVINICGWPGDKYGLTSFAGMSLTLIVPSSTTPQEVTLTAQGIITVGAPAGGTNIAVQTGTVVEPGTNIQRSGATGFAQEFGTGISLKTLLFVALGAGALIVLGRR